MAVEKMKIISIVGKLTDLDRVSRMIVLNGRVHMLNALSEINTNYFELEASEDHIQAMQELSDLKPYTIRRDFSKEEAIIKSFHNLFDIEQNIHEEYLTDAYNYNSIVRDLTDKYKTIKDISDKIKSRMDNINKIENYMQNLKYFQNTDLKLDELFELKQVIFKPMLISRENFQKLRKNYENIPSIVFQVTTVEENIVIISFTPRTLADDAEKIFESLNYLQLELPYNYRGTAEQISKELEKQIVQEEKQIETLKKSAEELKENYSDEVKKAYTLFELEKKQEHVKSEVAIGENLFFMFGFVPENSIEGLGEIIKDNFDRDVIVITENVASRRAGHAPPTKLINNRLFRPFELLVNMYGIPCYHEIDPTPFFALSYMLLFGAMFGDIGQGLVIFLGGLFIKSRTKNKDFGGIIIRLGISSMFFGLLYGSIFGNEHIIHGIWLKPMENINTMLVGAIILGIVFINIGYIYGLLNFYKREDIEEGIFGREGIVGLLFFWTLLITIVSQVTDAINFTLGIPIVIMILLLLLMVFKQPLANKLKGHKELYEDSTSEYYIEAGFGVIETVLSILSNIISFIRVGAFALNHVGLFIAFATMAEMLNSTFAGYLVLILGNIVIIGLEGLIVFIQSLRLEYYELFSKYYSGYGIQYKPANLLLLNTNKSQSI